MENHTLKQDSNLISESDLKILAKFVLKEIAINPDNDDRHPIEQMFSSIQNQLQQHQENNPLTKDVSSGLIASKNLTVYLRRAIKAMIKAHFNKSKEDYTKGAKAFNYAREQHLFLAVMWARKIDGDNENLRPDVHELMNKIRTHTDEIGNQMVNLIKYDLKKYKNYINAVNNVRYIDELISSLEKDFTELLKLAEKTLEK